MGIGNRLKEARRIKGFTQDSLAEAIGVSRGVITNIEHEKVEPQALVLGVISTTLGINKDWLINGTGKMESDKAEKSARILSEIYNSVQQLSEEEQDYILDLIKTFQKHKKDITNTDNNSR